MGRWVSFQSLCPPAPQGEAFSSWFFCYLSFPHASAQVPSKSVIAPGSFGLIQPEVTLLAPWPWNPRT